MWELGALLECFARVYESFGMGWQRILGLIKSEGVAIVPAA